MSKLSEKRCIPCEGSLLPLKGEQLNIMLKKIPGWELNSQRVEQLYRTFQFENFYQTISFVNVIAWIAHEQDHHPFLEIGYNNCTVRYWTHAINGLSQNDFICAERINNLYSTTAAVCHGSEA